MELITHPKRGGGTMHSTGNKIDSRKPTHRKIEVARDCATPGLSSQTKEVELDWVSTFQIMSGFVDTRVFGEISEMQAQV